MNGADKQVLSCQRLPARLEVDQAAELLGFTPGEIPVLMKARLLKPLGDPRPNGHKFFCSVEILALAQDRQWLDRATKAVSRHWQIRNKNGKGLLNAA